MSTGLTSWSNPGEIGGLYPLAGWEIPLVIVATVLWLLWHARQTRDESAEYDEALEMYKRVGLERALHHGGAARVADPHDLLAPRGQEAPVAGPRPSDGDPASAEPVTGTPDQPGPRV